MTVEKRTRRHHHTRLASPTVTVSLRPPSRRVRPVSRSGTFRDTARVVEAASHGEPTAMTRGNANYPLPSARVVLLFALGAAAFVVGVIESVGRVPPM